MGHINNLALISFSWNHDYIHSVDPFSSLLTSSSSPTSTFSDTMASPSRLTIRDAGYTPTSSGAFPTGNANSILDVPGVHVSQVTVPTSAALPEGSTATKGVTVISPRPPKDFYKPCSAGTFTFNGNGELTASRQIADWGFTNTPVAFTNSLSLGTVFDGMWDWVLARQESMGWDSLTVSRHYGTPVVGETADWMLNSYLKHSRVGKSDIEKAFAGLRSAEDGGFVREGQEGGGAGMTCHMYAGGTGTSSRVVNRGVAGAKEYTVGVLVQSNYGRLVDMVIGGVPVGRILDREDKAANAADSSGHDEGADVHAPSSSAKKATTLPTDLGGRTKDGSLLILIITDAPLESHQLTRLARHATVGLAAVGSYGSGRTHSGDIFLALSTADIGPEQLSPDVKMAMVNPTQVYTREVVKNESIDPYFYAVAEAVEEAILNSMVGGRKGTVGMDVDTKIKGFPMERVKAVLEKHLVKAQ